MTIGQTSTLNGPNDRVLRQLGSRAWAVVEGWLSHGQLHALRKQAVQLHRAAQMLPARVGHGSERKLLPEVRADLIAWITPQQKATPAQLPLWQALERLRVQLNRTLFLGLKRFEGHFAVYPPGAHYQKHMDQFRDAGHRQVSFVLFLNPVWSPQRGGALRLYAQDGEIISDVLPQWGRAVVFFSDSVPHEVLATRSERFSFTGWFCDDEESQR